MLPLYILHQFTDPTDLYNPTLHNEGDEVTDPLRLLQVMGGDEDCLSLFLGPG